MGAAFGGGSSNSVFGATGPAGFLGKLTYMLVAVWMILVLSLAFILKSQNAEETFEILPEENLIDEVQENEIPTS
jgi:preprotein translocase subunit SecG